jgi:hypothetical protein
MPAPDEIQQAFDRGVVSQTLFEYGQHLKAINGSTEKTALVLQEQAKAILDLAGKVGALVQRLDSETETRLALAAALKEAEDNRRVAGERRWNIPLGRLALALGVVGSLVGLWFAFRPG